MTTEQTRYEIGERLKLTRLNNIEVKVTQVWPDDRGVIQVVVANVLTGHDVLRATQDEFDRYSVRLHSPLAHATATILTILNDSDAICACGGFGADPRDFDRGTIAERDLAAFFKDWTFERRLDAQGDEIAVVRCPACTEAAR